MNINRYDLYRVITLFVVTGTVVFSCSHRSIAPSGQIQRLDEYVYSENEYIAEMFSDEDIQKRGIQPALTQTELDILDALVETIPLNVCNEFDQKYKAWLNCWAPLDSVPAEGADIRLSLKCNGKEFHDLIEFCQRQDDKVFLLLYQLAARADCPYDQLLLHPVNDLRGNFPEFNQYWREVNLALQKEKPGLENRKCNESTIWCTRKILETKYGYTYTSGLVALFDTRKMLLMTQ